MIPTRLQIGDTIGIISPSDPVTIHDKQFICGLQYVQDLGFTIIKGMYLNAQTAQEKADDIHTLFTNPTVKAIICAQGGDSAEQVLRFIDWRLIKKNPKIVMGISDITVLLNSIYHKTKLITFHGNDIKWGFGNNVTAYDTQEFTARLVEAKIGKIKHYGSRKTIRPGKAVGTLLGGNLRCLLKLADTTYWPDFSDAILMLEAYHITEKDCINLFGRLRELGVFDQVKGIIIGFIYGMQVEHPKSKQMEDILVDCTKTYNFPILKVNNFGHNCPNTTLPIGCKIEINADEKEITILDKCVKE